MERLEPWTIPNIVMYNRCNNWRTFWWQPDPIDTGGSGAGENYSVSGLSCPEEEAYLTVIFHSFLHNNNINSDYILGANIIFTPHGNFSSYFWANAQSAKNARPHNPGRLCSASWCGPSPCTRRVNIRHLIGILNYSNNNYLFPPAVLSREQSLPA